MKGTLSNRVARFKDRLAMLQDELEELFEEVEDDAYEDGYEDGHVDGYEEGSTDAQPERDESGKVVKKES